MKCEVHDAVLKLDKCCSDGGACNSATQQINMGTGNNDKCSNNDKINCKFDAEGLSDWTM